MQVARRLTAVIIWAVAIFLMLMFATLSYENEDPSGYWVVAIVGIIAIVLNLAFNWVFADKKETKE